MCLQKIHDYKALLGGLIAYDSIPVPLPYTQVSAVVRRDFRIDLTLFVLRKKACEIACFSCPIYCLSISGYECFEMLVNFIFKPGRHRQFVLNNDVYDK